MPAWKAETWATVGTAALTILAVTVSTVYQVGLRSRDLETHTAEIAALTMLVQPLPAQVAGLSAQVAALDTRMARMERCMDAHLTARP